MSPPTMERPSEDHESSLLALNMANWSVPSMVLKTVIELDILEIIKRAGPGAQLSPAEIVAELSPAAADPAAAAAVVHRLLRLLASYSVLTFSRREGTTVVYGLSPVGMFLTKNDEGVSYAGFSLTINNKVYLPVWEHLKDAVLEGETPFNKTYGTSIYDYFDKDVKTNDELESNTVDHSSFVMKNIVETYKGFEGISSIVDVGGKTGANLSWIIAKYPTIQGINYDLPYVIKKAPSRPGIKHVGGDMYASVPQADAIFMKWIIHIASDEQCIRLLKNCHAALPDHGKVIVCETIVPEVPEPSQSANRAYILDTIMLAFPGGKERTKAEFEALGKLAGFEGVQFICCVCDIWVLEFLKKI